MNTLQDANKIIQDAIKKAAAPTKVRGQIIYIRELNGDLVYSTCGYAPLGGGILRDLNGYNMYDVINALLDNNLGYQVIVGEDRQDHALTIKMWRVE